MGYLSTMLFILMMEALNNMMDRAVSGGLLKGFDASIRGHNNVTVIYYLQMKCWFFLCRCIPASSFETNFYLVQVV